MSASAGHVKIASRRVKVGSLYLCARCLLTVRYARAKAPSLGLSEVFIFFVQSAATARQRLHALAVQPSLTVRRTRALGVYVGNDDPSRVRVFAADTGTHPTLVTDFLDGKHGWTGMTETHLLSAWPNSGFQVVVAVPIIPDGTGATLARGAAGWYNSHFLTLARNLVRTGLSHTILRLGWEFNGNWFNWSVANSTDASNYAAYWRNIVHAMRSVPGQDFRFVWNPNGAPGENAFSAGQAYPGNAYVDYVGTDLYDEVWSSPKTPQHAWSADLSAQWGLNWLAAFAAAHGKPICFPEWSVDYRSDGAGLGDDPYFVNQFAAWTVTHDVVFANLFDFNTSGQQNAITDGHFPKSLAAFKSDFGTDA